MTTRASAIYTTSGNRFAPEMIVGVGAAFGSRPIRRNSEDFHSQGPVPRVDLVIICEPSLDAQRIVRTHLKTGATVLLVNQSGEIRKATENPRERAQASGKWTIRELAQPEPWLIAMDEWVKPKPASKAAKSEAKAAKGKEAASGDHD